MQLKWVRTDDCSPGRFLLRAATLKYLDLGARTFIPKDELPKPKLSSTDEIRERQERKAKGVVDRILNVFEEYRSVNRLLARSLKNGIIRKSGPRKELEDQILFLQEVAKVEQLAKFFPEVLGPKLMKHAAYYEMPFYEMKDLYNFLLGELFEGSCLKMAKRALEKVIQGPFLGLSSHGRLTELSPEIVQVLFFNRFNSRVEEAKEKLLAVGDAAEPDARAFNHLLDCERITIGGRALRGPCAILSEIKGDATFCARLKPRFLSWVHGDMHFKNILLDDRLPQMMDVKLVDPRGMGFGESRLAGDPAYDLGKLLFSSRGLSHLIQDQLFWPAHGSLRFDHDGQAEVGEFVEVKNERAPVPGGLSKTKLTSYRPTVEEWIWKVFKKLGCYVKEIVEQTGYPKGDPDWWLRACLYEALHFLSLAPMRVEEEPEVATNLFLRGTELLNRFLDDYRQGQFPSVADFGGAQREGRKDARCADH